MATRIKLGATEHSRRSRTSRENGARIGARGSATSLNPERNLEQHATTAHEMQTHLETLASIRGRLGGTRTRGAGGGPRTEEAEPLFALQGHRAGERHAHQQTRGPTVSRCPAAHPALGRRAARRRAKDNGVTLPPARDRLVQVSPQLLRRIRRSRTRACRGSPDVSSHVLRRVCCATKRTTTKKKVVGRAALFGILCAWENKDKQSSLRANLQARLPLFSAAILGPSKPPPVRRRCAYKGRRSDSRDSNNRGREQRQWLPPTLAAKGLPSVPLLGATTLDQWPRQPRGQNSGESGRRDRWRRSKWEPCAAAGVAQQPPRWERLSEVSLRPIVGSVVGRQRCGVGAERERGRASGRNRARGRTLSRREQTDKRELDKSSGFVIGVRNERACAWMTLAGVHVPSDRHRWRPGGFVSTGIKPAARVTDADRATRHRSALTFAPEARKRSAGETAPAARPSPPGFVVRHYRRSGEMGDTRAATRQSG
ncbi:hypothetical protein HPB48_002145 [Haemaphysalis longicornis]|uniref:Uncharacterized protein n=1 Tax=Haemaphysalis longicornis TaxID=44386 RepID=A0A9J6FH85_HAELO|nr:hypothetical protein HPB48_002145 [Haemaphysalis longicornis]